MGQPIDVTGTVRLGDVALLDTNRTLTGQDGEGYESLNEARQGATLPARLAERLFAADRDLASVFVLSNGLSLERNGGWTDEVLDRVTDIVRAFLVYYDQETSEPSLVAMDAPAPEPAEG